MFFLNVFLFISFTIFVRVMPSLLRCWSFDGISPLVVPCLTLFPHAFLCFAVETLCHAFLSLAFHCLLSFSARIYYAALPCLALPCPALLFFAFPCLVMLCLSLPCLALLCFALSCFALLCFAFLGFALSCFALTCLALPWLALPCLALPYLALPCLALSL